MKETSTLCEWIYGIYMAYVGETSKQNERENNFLLQISTFTNFTKQYNI